MNNKRFCMFINILFFMAIFCVSCSDHRVAVIINNNSGARINDVTLSYSGGIAKIEFIDDKAYFKTMISPNSETDLKLTFIDRKGEIIKRNVDVYIEKNYSGKIEITVNGNYDLSVDSKVSLR